MKNKNRIRTNNRRTIRKAFPRFVSLMVMSLLGVFVFAGLMATAPDMIRTLDRYLDRANVYDIRIVSDMGLMAEDVEAVAAMKGVLEAEGGKTLDVILNMEGDPVLRLNTLTGEINQPEVLEGRLPEQADEIALENYALPRLGLKIGDTIRIKDETLKAQELTIVGSVVSPLYYNQITTSGGRGNTSIGKGTVNYFAYVSEDALDLDYDTVLYVTVEGAKELTTSEEDYLEVVQTVLNRLEYISADREEARRQRLVDTYTGEIDQAETDSYAKLDEAYEEVLEGLNKLAAGETELSDAGEELAEAEQQLNDAREQLEGYETQLQSARSQLDSAKVLLESGKGQLLSSEAELEKSRKTLEQAEKQLSAGRSELDIYNKKLTEAYNTLAAAKAELDAKAPVLEQSGLQLAESEQQLQEARSTLDTSRAEYDQALADNGLTEGELESKASQLQSLLTLADAAISGYDWSIAQIDQKLNSSGNGGPSQEGTEGNTGSEDGTEGDAGDAGSNSGGQATSGSPNTGYVPGSISQAYLKAQRESLVRQRSAVVEQRAARQEQLDGINRLISARDELAAGEAQYEAGLAQYEAGLAEYEAGKAQYEAGLAQYEAGLSEYQTGREEYQKQEAVYQESLAAYQEGKARYEAGLAAYEAGRAELAGKQQQYEQGEAEYQTGLSEYEAGVAAYEEGLSEYQTGLTAYQEGQAEYNSGAAEYQKALDRFRDNAEITISLPEFQDAYTALEDAEEAFARAREDIADQIRKAREEVEEIPMPNWYLYDRTNYATYADYIDDANSIRNLSGIFPIVFFAVAVLVSLISMNRMVEEDRLEIGTLKSMGFGDRLILSKYLLFSMAATIVGGILGAASGLIIIPELIYNIYRLLFDLPALSLTVQPVSTLLGFFLTVLCVCGTSVVTVFQVLKEKPSELMRPKVPKNGRSILLEKIPWFWNRLSFSRKVTIRNLFRYKKRVLVTIGGIAGCTALMLTGFGIRDSIVDLPNAQYVEVYQFDGTAYASEVRAEDFQGSSQITSAYPVQQRKATAKNQSIAMFIAEDADSMSRIAHLYDAETGEELALEPGKIIVTEKFATTEGIQVGDVLEIVDVDQYSYQLEVSGIAVNYISHYVYLTRETYEQADHTFTPNLVYFNTGEMTEEEQDKLAEELLSTGRILNVSFRSAMLESIGKMLGSLNSVVWILLVLAAMLSFVVLYNLANININERRREIATLKVLGFYDREVDAYITRETVILTAAGIALGLTLGIFISHAVVANVEIAYCRFINRVQPLSFVYAAAFSVLFTWIVNVITHFNLKRINMIDSLKSVE